MVDPKSDTIRAHWKCFFACGIVILCPFQYGLDFGIIGGFQAMPGFLQVYGQRAPNTVIGWNIPIVRQQLISSLVTLGAFISSGTAGLLAIKLGRKTCLWMACLLCIVANVIMMTTTHIGALYAGRLLLGVANGGLMTFSQLYIQETSPAKYRGLFFTCFSFFTSFGTLIGTIVDWATAKRPDKSSYLIPLGIVFAVPVVLALALLILPESPRWLLEKGRLEDSCKALTWLRPAGHDSEDEANQIQLAIQKEQETKSGAGFADMFRDPVDRRRTIISICALSLAGVPGSMFIIAYKAYFLTMARVENPFAMSNVLSAIGLLGLITSSLIVVRYGRRRVLLINGILICGGIQLAMAVAYDKHGSTPVTGRALVALSSLYFFFFNGMIAPFAWLLGGEIPSQRLRSHTFGLAAAIGFLFSWSVTFTTPYFINPDALNWGPRYGYIWFPSCIIGALWTFFFLPETKGRTLEEVDEMFLKRLPARKFRTYQCEHELGQAHRQDKEKTRASEDVAEVEKA